MDKNSRKQSIVLAAVDDYIKNAQPITSASINVHFKNLSSATLRNELNALESMGYFKQLHTSGGRIPTGLAYKEYVNTIIKSNKFNYKSLKSVLNNYDEHSVSLLSTLSSLAKRLSRATNCPTVLVQHGLKNLTIQNIQIVPLINKDALLLVETEAGVIDDSLSLDGNIGRSACEEASTFLTQRFKDKTISYMLDNINDVCLNAGAQMIGFKRLITSVADALVQLSKTRCDVSNENPTKLFEGLNKYEMEDALTVYEFLQDTDKMIDMVKDEGDIQFTVGEDDGKLKGGMMMSAPIVINGVPIASLALIGPRRIDYSSVAAALKFMVNQIDNLKGDSNG